MCELGRAQRSSKTTYGLVHRIIWRVLALTTPPQRSPPGAAVVALRFGGGVLPLGRCLLFRGSRCLATRMLAPAVHLLDGGSINFSLVLRIMTRPS